ncbi:MAG: chemotaxis protein CheA [Armatimonadota bacterium]
MSDENLFDTSDSELFNVFLEEAREQIDVLDRGLVRLEREQDNTELIQGIFRAAHTLKGSSATMGLRQMANLTHAMEDVLDKVREHALTVTADVGDMLLQGLDLLRGMQHAVEEGRGETLTGNEPIPIAVELRALATNGGKPTEAKEAEQGVSLQALPTEQVALLVNFAEDCQMPGIRAFLVLRQLEQLGTLCFCSPSREEIDQNAISNRLLLTVETECSEEQLRQAAMQVAEVEWVRVARGTAAAGMRIDMPSREELTQEEQIDGSVGERRTTQTQPTNGIQPQQSVRVSVETLDRIMNLVGELVLDRTRVAQLKEELPEEQRNEDFIHDLDTVSQHLGTIVEELHEQVMRARMLPVSQLFSRFPRMVRDISRKLGKEVEFQVDGEDELLDRSVIEKLVDPLTHLLRNAVDHGLESPDEREDIGKPRCGTIQLTARRREEHVLIEVSDDGPGLDANRLKEKAVAAGVISAAQAQAMNEQEAYSLIFASGFSTAKQVTDVSGRGVGMDVVKKNIDSVNGSIQIDSQYGFGTTMTLKIPLTLAIIRALIVRVGQVYMAVPITMVEETIVTQRRQVHSIRGRGVVRWRDIVVPVIRLCEALPGCGISSQRDALQLVAVRYESRVACLAVDDIVGHQEIVVKPLGSFLGEIPGLAGATILGSGRVALILDISKLFDSGLLQQAAAQGIDDVTLDTLPELHETLPEADLLTASVA